MVLGLCHIQSEKEVIKYYQCNGIKVYISRQSPPSVSDRNDRNKLELE